MNIYIREFKHSFKRMILNDKNKTTGVKWKQSLIAIILALVLSSILIITKGSNPLTIFKDIIKGATLGKESWQQTWLYFSMFLLAGTSIIVGFKSGLFNIGIGGQMLISGAIVMMLAVQYKLPWILLLIIAMCISGFAAAISGVLKALFNIHEVVSTILINWIFFWLSQYLLGSGQAWMNNFGSTKPIEDGSRMIIGESIALPAIMVAVSLLVLAIIFFKYTKWGFALKTVGQSEGAAEYAGIKVVYQMAIGMALSGIAAGALASVNYLGKFGSMSYSVNKSLPSIGFQGISVALISFNSLYGLLPAAFFWAIITSGTDYSSIVNPTIPKEILSLMNGFIIYAIAISIIFIRFKPISFIFKYIARMRSEQIRNEIKKYNKAKQSEINLFTLSRESLIDSYDKKNNQEKIFKLQEDLKNISKELKIISDKYKKENPLSWLELWNLKKAIMLRQEKLYEKQSKLIDKQEMVEKELEKLKNNSLKNELLKMKFQKRGGINIISIEHKKRVKSLQEKYLSQTIFGKWLTRIKISKEKSNNYLSKLAILKIEKNEKIAKVKKVNNDKELILKIKNEYTKSVLQLERNIEKGNK